MTETQTRSRRRSRRSPRTSPWPPHRRSCSCCWSSATSCRRFPERYVGHDELLERVVRVFPLSNWTELDVWQYIAEERIEVPSIYFAHIRPVFEREGMLMSVNEHLEPDDGAEVFEARVRFRTVGDADCTGCVESPADTIERIIEEVGATRLTERGATRADDRISESGMEDRKREGYF